MYFVNIRSIFFQDDIKKYCCKSVCVGPMFRLQQYLFLLKSLIKLSEAENFIE